MTTAQRVIHFGPMVGLQWGNESRLWLQRLDLEYIRAHLLPVAPPRPGIAGTCWVWTGPAASDGRPMMTLDGHPSSVRRVMYDVEYGPLSGRDYLSVVCGVPRCCNPHHCRPEARGPIRGQPGNQVSQHGPGFDRCKYGHPLTPDNSYVYEGRKLCRTCRAAAEKRHRERSGAARSAARASARVLRPRRGRPAPSRD